MNKVRNLWYIKMANDEYFVCLAINIGDNTVSTTPLKEGPIFLSDEQTALKVSSALYDLGFPNDVYNFYNDHSWGDFSFSELDDIIYG